MQRCGGLLFVPMLFCLLAPSAVTQATEQAAPPVAATVVTTLATQGKQIRMLAFDGDPNTFFASAKNAAGSDHFTLVFDKPVAVKSIVVTTGRPDGANKSDALVLQVSQNGKTFEDIAKFKDGMASAKVKGQQVLAVRIKPTADLSQPFVIREIAIDSDPRVTAFKYPVEFIVNVSDAPQMKEWAEKVAKVCERAYQWMGDDLASPGFKPPTLVMMTLKSNYNGVAATGGVRITGSVAYFKRKPDDVGAMVHETVHVQQQYKGRGNPGWLVEGIADYIRFFKYEPGKIGKLNVAKAKYNGSYRVTARFLAYVTDKYKKDLVLQLNRAMREGRYKEEIWKDFTGKTLRELDEEWRASLKKLSSYAVDRPRRGPVDRQKPARTGLAGVLSLPGVFGRKSTRQEARALPQASGHRLLARLQWSMAQIALVCVPLTGPAPRPWRVSAKSGTRADRQSPGR